MLNNGPAIAENSHHRAQKCAAWGVHVLTAMGAVTGLPAMVAITQGQWQIAFAWMGVALTIDSVDGMLARAFKVKTVLPGFDGALLDNIVDYFTYVIVPAFFLYQTALVPKGWNTALAAMITLASGYQFCQADAKTQDHCFKGFPSYWNLVVFYLFLLDWPKWINAMVLMAFAGAVFIPIKYIYPTRTRVLRPLTVGFGLIYGAVLLVALLRYPEGHEAPLYLSFFYVFYYLIASLYLSIRGYPPVEESDA